MSLKPQRHTNRADRDVARAKVLGVEDARPVAEQRLLLVATIRAAAQWRSRKADEFAHDHKARRENSRAALALRTLANFVDALPDHDPELALHALRRTDKTQGRLALTHDAGILLSRFGLGYGSWQDGTPTEQQMRNLLRRVDGIEARERYARKRQAEDGYDDR